MFVILWEFEVKPGNQVRFESAYGPDGAWAQLFKRDPHFRKTRLVQDPSRPLYYFTLDFWDSESSYRNFLDSNQAGYKELDASFVELTKQERHILSCTLDPWLLTAC
jgi:heme-degrading monooxygenase HmoA